MNICFPTSEYTCGESMGGGLASYLGKTSKQLVKMGHAPSIFVLSRRNSEWPDSDVKIIEVKRTFFLGRCLRAVSRISPGIRPLVPFIDRVFETRVMAARILKEHKAGPFDMIQTSSYMAPGLSLAGRNSPPTVCRISSNAPYLRSSSGRVKGFSDVLTDWLEIRQIIKSDAAFATSRFMSEVFHRLEALKVGVVPTPLDIVEDGLDASVYEQKLSGKRYFLFCGTLNRVKGVDLLADVIIKVVNQHKAIVFVFAGRDYKLPEGYTMFDYIMEYPQMPLGNVFYLGTMPKNRFYPVMRHALALLLPSRVDNYPNVCLESLSMGVPVIGTYKSSIEEIVSEGETGFLAENGGSESLLKAVDRFLNMSDREIALIRGRMKQYIEQIKREDRIGQLIEYYESVLEDASLENKAEKSAAAS